LIILDASALYPLAKLAAGRLDAVAERLVVEEAAVLDLTLYEAVNAAVVEARRGLVEDLGRVLSSLALLAEALRVIRVEPGDLEAIGRLAAGLRLTGYDAAYVYYARRSGARLVTGDRELLRKAPDVAVSVEEWLRGETGRIGERREGSGRLGPGGC